MRFIGYTLAITVALGVLVPGVCPAQGLGSGITTEVHEFDVFRSGRKVGHMRLKIMTVKDVVILDEELEVPFKGKGKAFPARVESQVVFRGAASPMPQRGKLTARIGNFKIMDGTVEFTPASGGLSAKAEATGYADVERNPFETPRTWEKQLSLPGEMVLTRAAMLHFAPRLLPRPGKIENVTQLVFPHGFGWPSLISVNADCVLQRHPTSLEGTADITLHRVFVGGNIKSLLKMTVDAENKVVEFRFGGFTVRPASTPSEEKPSK